ncbi:MAG: hypothetical protein ACFCGT_11280 [Sandaracinaceae bacterium]
MTIRLGALLPLLLVACGGPPAPPHTAASAAERTGRTADTAVQLCLQDAPGIPRSDYPYVASYQCPDGSVPLDGNPRRGQLARLGNVGQGPDGHVLDLYEVPCPSGPVRIFVDGYHCPGGVDPTPDLANLTPQQLAGMAVRMRQLETEPFDEEASEFRGFFHTWLEETDQVTFGICEAVIEDVMREEYAFRELVVSQYILSSAAAAIELPEGTQRPLGEALAGIRGALRIYSAIVQARGSAAAEPHLSMLADLAPEALEARVAQNLDTCTAARPDHALLMTDDTGRSLWPPSGPDCDRLIRCCEGKGYVRDGAGVGAEGLMCVMAGASTGDETDGCAFALRALAEQGTPCR